MKAHNWKFNESLTVFKLYKNIDFTVRGRHRPEVTFPHDQTTMVFCLWLRTFRLSNSSDREVIEGLPFTPNGGNTKSTDISCKELRTCHHAKSVTFDISRTRETGTDITTATGYIDAVVPSKTVSRLLNTP
jgi:hypothetical protein